MVDNSESIWGLSQPSITGLHTCEYWIVSDQCPFTLPVICSWQMKSLWKLFYFLPTDRPFSPAEGRTPLCGRKVPDPLVLNYAADRAETQKLFLCSPGRRLWRIAAEDKVRWKSPRLYKLNSLSSSGAGADHQPRQIQIIVAFRPGVEPPGYPKITWILKSVSWSIFSGKQFLWQQPKKYQPHAHGMISVKTLMKYGFDTPLKSDSDPTSVHSRHQSPITWVLWCL